MADEGMGFGVQLKISWRVIKIPLLALMLCLIVLLPLIEGMLRYSWLAESLPPPTIGKDSIFPEVDVKLWRLDQLVKTEEINCFILGNSMADAALDPALLNRRFAEEGIPYRCFSFALAGFTMQPAADLAEFLVARYRPAVIILGVDPQAFEQTAGGTREFSQIPWVRYLGGESSFEGWLVDHFLTYRTLLSLPKFRDEKYRQSIEEYLRDTSAFGFHHRGNPQGGWAVLADGARFQAGARVGSIRMKLFEPMLTDYRLSEADTKGMERMIALSREMNISLLAIEIPVFPDHFPYHIEGGEAIYRSQFLEPISAIFTEGNIPWILTQNEMAGHIPVEGWHNRNHLNPVGAKVFTEWAAGQITSRYGRE